MPFSQTAPDTGDNPFSKTILNIWDLDNCIYPYNTAFHDACHRAAAMAAKDLDVQHDELMDLIQLAASSYTHFGDVCHIFIQNHKVNRDAMHELYRKHMSTSFLSPCAETAKAFAINDHVQAVLSNAKIDDIHNTLAKLLYFKHFNESLLIGIEAIGTDYPKDTSTKGLQLMLGEYEKLTSQGITAHSSVMIDASSDNLFLPHELGMTTVQITYGKEVKQQPHVDFVFDTPLELLTFQNKC